MNLENKVLYRLTKGILNLITIFSILILLVNFKVDSEGQSGAYAIGYFLGYCAGLAILGVLLSLVRETIIYIIYGRKVSTNNLFKV